MLDFSWTDDGGHTLYASYGIAVWGTLCSQWNTCDFRFCHLYYFITWNRWTVDYSGIQVNKSSVEAVDKAQKKQKETEKKMEQAESKACNEKKRAELEIQKA